MILVVMWLTWVLLREFVCACALVFCAHARVLCVRVFV